jgi:hypothetical protein
MALGSLIGRFAGQNMLKAMKLGAPGWTDVAMNAFPSLLYGGSLMMQGANPLEAVGTAASDLGFQMAADTLFGTAGARLGMKFAPQYIKDRAMKGLPKSDKRINAMASKWGNVGKMGSMATMFLPNPVANSFYDRMQEEQQPLDGVGVMAAAPAQSSLLDDPYTNELIAKLDPEQQQYATALLSGVG